MGWFLFASLFWGSVGVAYFIYGKKQSCWPAMGGGLIMMVLAYFAGSVWLMSLLCICLMILVYWLVKRGY